MPSSSSSSSSSSDYICKKTDLSHHTLSIFCQHARNLRNVETIGKLDPYVIVKVGKQQVVSPVYKDIGCNPTFNLHFKMAYGGQKTVRFIVKDKKRLGRDKECGRGKLVISSISGKLSAQVVKLSFKDKKGKKEPKDSGFIFVNYKFVKTPVSQSSVEKYDPQDYVAGDKIPEKVDISHDYKSIRFTVYGAKNLKDTETFGKIDAYAAVTMGKVNLRSATMTNSGVNPMIKTAFVMPYSSERMIHLKFFDHDVGADDSVGSVKIDLLPFFKLANHPGRGRVCLALKGKDSTSNGSVDCKVELLKESVSESKAKKLESKSSSSSSSSS